MGYAANGFCFDTPDGAAAFACGHDFPVASAGVDASGQPTLVLLECTASAGNVLTLQRDVNGAAVGTSTLALTSPACDTAEWHTFYPFSWSVADGAELGGAVLFAWSVAWGWKAVYSVLRGKVSASVADAE